MHGPAVHFTKIVAQFKTSSENFSAIPKDTDASEGTSAVQHFQQEKTSTESPTTGSAELEITSQISIEENRGSESSVQSWAFPLEDIPKNTDSGGKSFFDVSPS